MTLRINKGRSVLLYSHNWLALQMDGKCLSGVFLTDDEKIALETALRNSRSVKSSIASP